MRPEPCCSTARRSNGVCRQRLQYVHEATATYVFTPDFERLLFIRHRKPSSTATGTVAVGRVNIGYADGHVALKSDFELVDPVTARSTCVSIMQVPQSGASFSLRRSVMSRTSTGTGSSYAGSLSRQGFSSPFLTERTRAVRR